MYFRSVYAISSFLLYSVWIISVSPSLIDGNSCTTPDRATGSCVLAKECPSLVNFLKIAPKPIPQSVAQKLRTYACGYDREQVKFCCPEEDMSMAVAIQNRSTHRNMDLLPSDCGYVGVTDKNFRNTVQIGEYPWLALLWYKTAAGPKFRCGGTIINNRYILTAARCITELKEPLLGVRVGEFDVRNDEDCDFLTPDQKICSPPPKDLAIEEVIPHPNFTTGNNYSDVIDDIGLIRVAPIQFSDYVQPICLDQDEVSSNKVDFAVSTGWGFHETDSNVTDIPQRTTFKPVGECKNHYQNANISKKYICGKPATKGSCVGDSGGPLQTVKFVNDDIKFILYGIQSFGTTTCEPEMSPKIFTKIYPYTEWILDNIKP